MIFPLHDAHEVKTLWLDLWNNYQIVIHSSTLSTIIVPSTSFRVLVLFLWNCTLPNENGNISLLLPVTCSRSGYWGLHNHFLISSEVDEAFAYCHTCTFPSGGGERTLMFTIYCNCHVAFQLYHILCPLSSYLWYMNCHYCRWCGFVIGQGQFSSERNLLVVDLTLPIVLLFPRWNELGVILYQQLRLSFSRIESFMVGGIFWYSRVDNWRFAFASPGSVKSRGDDILQECVTTLDTLCITCQNFKTGNYIS